MKLLLVTVALVAVVVAAPNRPRIFGPAFEKHDDSISVLPTPLEDYHPIYDLGPAFEKHDDSISVLPTPLEDYHPIYDLGPAFEKDIPHTPAAASPLVQITVNVNKDIQEAAPGKLSDNAKLLPAFFDDSIFDKPEEIIAVRPLPLN